MELEQAGRTAVWWCILTRGYDVQIDCMCCHASPMAAHQCPPRTGQGKRVKEERTLASGRLLGAWKALQGVPAGQRANIRCIRRPARLRAGKPTRRATECHSALSDSDTDSPNMSAACECSVSKLLCSPQHVT